MKDTLIVIPARLNSKRLKNKPLVSLVGKPLIVRTYENLAPLLKKDIQIVVATDSKMVLKVCRSNNIPCVLTSRYHNSGTDRCYEVAKQYRLPFVVNVQADEPFINIVDIMNLIKCIKKTKWADIATLVYPSSDKEDFNNTNVVKAIITEKHYKAIYFTRMSVPYHRTNKELFFWQHIGVYAYKLYSLKKFCSFPKSFLEQTEQLEQLRALENNMQIVACKASTKTLSIDTPEDLANAQNLYAKIKSNI